MVKLITFVQIADLNVFTVETRPKTSIILQPFSLAKFFYVKNAIQTLLSNTDKNRLHLKMQAVFAYLFYSAGVNSEERSGIKD